jgi:Domain of unknown function (DUF4234)
MAEQVSVGGTQVKIRNPWLVFVWAIVTFGIYYFVWYYKVNRELRDACGIDVSPFVALLAVTVGWIVIVPPFVSWYRTFGRIRAAQEEKTASPALGLVLYLVALVAFPVELVYAQYELNRIWRRKLGR